MGRDPDRDFMRALGSLTLELGRPVNAPEVEEFLGLEPGEAARETMFHLLGGELVCPVGRDISDPEVRIDAATEDPLIITRRGREFMAEPPRRSPRRRKAGAAPA